MRYRISQVDRDKYSEQGYLVIPGVIRREKALQQFQALCHVLGIFPDKPETWYRKPLTQRGLVELYHHQRLWDFRQDPALYATFCQLYQTRRLWVSIDRLSCIPPVHPDYPGWGEGLTLHLDVIPEGKKVGNNAFVALTDITVENAPFFCLPGMHREMVTVSQTTQAPTYESFSGLFDHRQSEVTPVLCQAGDLVMFNMALPHGRSPNTGAGLRMIQYVTMFPVRGKVREKREERIALWQNNLPANLLHAHHLEVNLDNRHANPARLTRLGRRLLGIDPYPKRKSRPKSWLGRQVQAFIHKYFSGVV
jgi:hypothetical protein